MAEGSQASTTRHPAPAAHAATTLTDGTVVTVEVSAGPETAGASAFRDADALASRGLAAAVSELSRSLERREPEIAQHPSITGRSAPMLALFRMLERIRNSDATVLVLGENGTGKELVARSVHTQSRRGHKQFIAANCSAFNDNLLESELFGHRRGAFTGAVSDKPGLFEVADGGTFFMDEVGDMSAGMQVKLLRVLQEGVFTPVGGTETRRVDVRIVAATNRDLAAMVKKGTFREDLYYRLHVVSLRVPPLRERRDDVPVLAAHFLARLSRRDKREKVLTPRTLERLVAHEWPGNVRELENELERLWVLAGDDRIVDEDLLSPSIGRRRAPVPGLDAAAATPATTSPASAPQPTPGTATGPTKDGEADTSGTSMPDAVETLERRMITEALRKARGNKTKAADALGISRRNLIRKVQAYALDEAAPVRSAPRPPGAS